MRAFSYVSRDKDGGHTIRSAVVENAMLHAKFTALCFIEPELSPIEVLHCGNRNFQPFLAPVTMTLTFVYELDPWAV